MANVGHEVDAHIKKKHPMIDALLHAKIEVFGIGL